MYIPLKVNIWWNLIHFHGFQLLVLLPKLIEVSTFICTNRINLLRLRWNSDRLGIVAKSVFKAAKLAYANKTREQSPPRNVDITTFGDLLIVIWGKENLLYFLVLTELRFCLLLLTKQDFLQKNFSQKSNLDDSGISSSAFHFRTTLTEQYFFNWIIFLLLVKKVINNLDLSRASGPGCIPVMVLKIREPQLSYILASFFNMYLQESYFPDSWKVLSVVLVFKNDRERSIARNYRHVKSSFCH